MNIAIDARLAAKGRGLGEFAYQVISHLPADPHIHYFIISYDTMAWPTEVLPDGATIITVPNSYVISEQIVLPWLLRRHKIDLYHATTNTAPLWLPSSTKLLLTIHDAMFLTDKQRIPTSTSWYQRLGRKYYAAVSRRIIKKAQAITTISHFSQQDIAEGFAIDPQAIQVIYEGVGEEFKPQPAKPNLLNGYQLKSHYFLHLGAIDPRKQTEFVIKAFAEWRRQYPDKPHQLAITGLSPKDSQAFNQLIQQLNLQDAVRLLGFVSKADLVSLMSSAQALLFPSLYEGFGLPMLQAMACYCPVITTEVTALPEIGQQAALYIQPGRTQQLIDNMAKITIGPELRQELIRSGRKQAAKFNWQHTSAQYAALYQDILNR